MDKMLLRKRVDAIETGCNAAIEWQVDNHWAVPEDTVTFSARRILELVKLARVGLEHLEADDE